MRPRLVAAILGADIGGLGQVVSLRNASGSYSVVFDRTIASLNLRK
jgi:hypothetical protein